MYLKVLAVEVLVLSGISLIKYFCVVNAQRLQLIDYKFCTHTRSSNSLLHKSVSKIFLIMSYSTFAAILWQILKPHFERKQSKTDYPKDIRKEEKCVHGFFGSWLYAFQWEKTIENHKYVGARARKVENLVRFRFNFDPYFPNIRRARRRCKIYSESIEIYCKNIESIESMYWNRSCILCCVASKFWNWIASPWNT